ncbi:MAG: hypothetical protein HEP71_26975 [Roseivirga sp.]|nr:hypothetical protein [Roseivirga sp.]
MTKYHLRPAYESKELLIKFTSRLENDNFISNLEAALAPLNTVFTGSEDLWMNDEVLVQAKCDLGAFEISIDHWGLAFLIARGNPRLINRIDSLLNENPIFEKELIDFENPELKHE